MKPAALRWTLNQAATEFGLDRHTLATRVQTAAIVAGEDGKFSTSQIASAIYGNMAGERLRKTKLEADLMQLKVLEQEKQSIPVQVIVRVVGPLFGSMSAIIKRAPLSHQDREELLRELRELGPAMQREGFSVENPPLSPENAAG